MHGVKKLSLLELLSNAEHSALNDPTCDSEPLWIWIRELRRRGGQEIFDAAAGWCESPDKLLRCLGVNVLAQLDSEGAFPFARASEPIFCSLLSDSEAQVVACALVALGHQPHLGDPAMLYALCDHSSAEVREDLAFCLASRDDELSVEALIRLSADVSSNARNWATFGLGTQCELDTPAIRNALAARLAEEDHEIRGEGILGLAKRGDARAIPAIDKELEQDSVSILVFRAAAVMPDRCFLSRLEAFQKTDPDDEEIRIAVERCQEI